MHDASSFDGLLHDIIEGKMKGKPTRGIRLQILYDVRKVMSLKQAAEERKRWKYSGTRST